MRLIDADSLMKKFDPNDVKLLDTIAVRYRIATEETVQPEQRTGKWLCRCNKDREEWLECSKCGHNIGVRYTKNYCPNCGRKMMGEGVK